MLGGVAACVCACEYMCVRVCVYVCWSPVHHARGLRPVINITVGSSWLLFYDLPRALSPVSPHHFITPTSLFLLFFHHSTLPFSLRLTPFFYDVLQLQGLYPVSHPLTLSHHHLVIPFPFFFFVLPQLYHPFSSHAPNPSLLPTCSLLPVFSFSTSYFSP